MDKIIAGFEDIVSSAIRRHKLLRDGAPVLVTVSGGADSVCLLAVLVALGYDCVAAHCNFHLRGAESERDMRHVQQVCAAMGVDLYIRDFDVDAQRALTGESVEMACRSLRYQWFADLLDKLRAQAIAVAHHREDNVETFFLNLMRGSSITGLTGMRRRNGYVVRPLLDVSRADIERYLEARNIEYVTDSTNAMNVYARNKIRNVVLPAIEREFPGAIDGILESIGYLHENRSLYDNTVAQKSRLYMPGNVLHLAELLEAEGDDARLLLFEMLRPMGYNMSQVDDIIASAGKSGLTFASRRTSLVLDRGRLLVAGRSGSDPDELQVNLQRDILAPVHINISEHPVTAFKPERNPAVAYFDASMLDGDPVFTLRRWRRGDRIRPFGMRGTRLVSDIFSDAKYSAVDKRNTWLLTRNGVIVWIVGLRSADIYTVTPETRRFVRLAIE